LRTIQSTRRTDLSMLGNILSYNEIDNALIAVQVGQNLRRQRYSFLFACLYVWLCAGIP